MLSPLVGGKGEDLRCSLSRGTPCLKTERKIRCCFLPEYSAPKFTDKIKNKYEVWQNRTVRIRCRVNGNPPPTLSWKKDGAPITKTKRIKIVTNINSQYLKIKKAVASDSGYYVCVARNVYGMVNATIKLKVKGRSGCCYRSVLK
jgi:hypothetical protein